MSFLKRILSRDSITQHEAEVIGCIKTFPDDSVQIQVRARDVTLKMNSDDLVARDYWLALQTASASRTRELSDRLGLKKEHFQFSDGSRALEQLPVGDDISFMDAIPDFCNFLRGKGIIVSENAIDEIINQDCAKYRGRYRKANEVPAKSSQQR